jgi:DNA adenine methylase
MNKPFLKWAGNKFRVLSHILPLIGSPKQYIEPFSGSMAVALNVAADSMVLNDFNDDLISLYRYVMNDEEFIDDCEKVCSESNNQETFYQFRDIFNTTSDSRHKAILFVYLNRHCFNGLTRYNKKGQFNVPFGKYSSPYFPRKEMENFKEVFEQKHLVCITSGDFASDELYENVDSNTVVYFDPPYLPLTDTANFSDYATGGFNYDDQVRLRDLAKSLANRGARVIISNHDTPVARELYSSASITSIDVGRFIAAKGTSRQKVKEVLAVWN